MIKTATGSITAVFETWTMLCNVRTQCEKEEEVTFFGGHIDEKVFFTEEFAAMRNDP